MTYKKNESNESLKAYIEGEINDSIGYLETETTHQRQEALEYYMREKYGNEQPGKSQIVTGEVAEIIDGALPQILRTFTASKKAVEFEPVSSGDAEQAEQATNYVNHIFYKDNQGFSIMHDWFKDSLLQKVGITKAYWDDSKDVTTEKYYGLDDNELALILDDDDVKIVSQKTTEEEEENPPQPVMDPMSGQPQIDPMTGMPMMQDVPPTVIRTHDIKVSRESDKGRVKIETVPPEEFLISKRARTIADSDFTAHRKMVTRSELVAMGYDEELVYSLATGDALDFTPERIARYSRGELPTDMDNLEPALELVEYYECYIKTDFNGDGIAELRRVCYASNEILADEECDYIPFHSLCPIPIPHKFFGQSLADRGLDLQLIKSTVTRQMLDNLYLTNNYRVGAVEGQVNLDDLLTSTAGGVVRIKSPNALVPMQVTSNANQSFPMLEYLDGVQAKRTGVSDAQQGLDPSILQNVTATAIAAMTNQAGGKLELIARIFAETGVTSLFKGIFHLVCKYQQKERIIRVNKEFVSFDPREWKNEYNVTVNVGLGTGSKQEQLSTMQMILQKQEEIIKSYGIGNPLVNLKQYRDTLAKFVHMAGFKDDSQFLMEVSEEQAMQMAQEANDNPTADSQVAAAEALAKAEIQKAQMRAQSAEQKLMLDREQMQLDAQKDALELQMKEIQQTKEFALQELELAIKAKGQQDNSSMAKSKTIMDALEKINNITQKGMQR